MSNIFNPTLGQRLSLGAISVALLGFVAAMALTLPGDTTALAAIAVTLLGGIMSTLYLWLRTL